jgi:2-polyprenyl-6-methoxyphenol hydroxylase-like FAD-dependent oxidoreductase
VSPRVAVIGGSLTGPVAALSLLARGFDDVHVYEATPQAVTLAGGVIGLQHPALNALEQVGIEQDEIIPTNSEQVILIQVRDQEKADRTHRIYPGRNTTWTLLNAALKRRLPAANYHNSKRLVEIRESDSGPATLLFADGTDVVADLIVFADGRKSFGRKLLDPARKLTYAGYVAHRGMMTGMVPELLNAFYSFQPEQALFNTFPAFMLDGSIKLDWTFFLDTRTEQFEKFFGGKPTARTFVFPRQITPEAVEFVNHEARRRLPQTEARVVCDTTERMAAPIVDIDAPTQMVWSLGKSRAVLVGDALAPPRPHTGQGANRGIDQVADLALALHQHTRWGADLDAALSAWESRHIPVVKQYLSAGRAIGRNLRLGQA